MRGGNIYVRVIRVPIPTATPAMKIAVANRRFRLQYPSDFSTLLTSASF